MCPVVHRIDFPACTCPVVRPLQDTIHHRVSHIHIGRGHIYFCTERHCPFFKLPVLHSLKKVERLLYRAISVRRVYTGLGRVFPLLGNEFGGLLIYIGFPFFYEPYCPVIKLLEVIRSIELFIPLKAEPFYIFLYGIYKLLLFFFWVGIIKAEIYRRVVLLTQTKVDANSLRMPNMQITIRLWRKTKTDFIGAKPVCYIFFYDLLNEIEGFFFFVHILKIRVQI